MKWFHIPPLLFLQDLGDSLAWNFTYRFHGDNDKAKVHLIKIKDFVIQLKENLVLEMELISGCL